MFGLGPLMTHGAMCISVYVRIASTSERASLAHSLVECGRSRRWTGVRGLDPYTFPEERERASGRTAASVVAAPANFINRYGALWID